MNYSWIGLDSVTCLNRVFNFDLRVTCALDLDCDEGPKFPKRTSKSFVSFSMKFFSLLRNTEQLLTSLSLFGFPIISSTLKESRIKQCHHEIHHYQFWYCFIGLANFLDESCEDRQRNSCLALFFKISNIRLYLAGVRSIINPCILMLLIPEAVAGGEQQICLINSSYS